MGCVSLQPISGRFMFTYLLTSCRGEAEDDPTLDWFDIQPELMEAGADVLLILDCCYAGQATRSRRFVQLQCACGMDVVIPPDDAAQLGCRDHSVLEHHASYEMCLDALPLAQATRNRYREGRNQVEILMACAMGVRTPGPGKESFTSALIRAIHLCANSHHLVETTELVKQLSLQKAGLRQSPIHVMVQARTPNRTIQFTPQPRTPPAPISPIKASTIYIRVCTRTRVDQNALHATLAWLKENAPSDVSSIQVDDIEGTLQEFVTQEQRASFRQVQPTARIFQWSKDYRYRLGSLTIPNRLDTRILVLLFSHILLYLKKLVSHGSDLLRKLERNLPTLSIPAAKEWLRNMHIEVTVQNQGFTAWVNIPRMALFSQPTDLEHEVSHNAGQLTNTALENAKGDTLDLAPFLEYITYEKEVLNSDTLKSYSDHVQNIVAALHPSQAAEFQALPCSGWFHEPSKKRFGLTFQAPQGCIVPPVTLYQLIKDRYEPTLDQRYALAWRIGKALQNWHRAGWAHQGISSRNIVFFRKTTISDPEFTAPYLSGFRHSRHEAFVARQYCQDPVVHKLSCLDCQVDVSRPYQKLDDVYFYGVLLMEIGLWRLFPAAVSQKTKQRMKTDEMRRTLIEIAEEARLGFHMGKTYRDSTIKCLKGDFGLSEDERVGCGLEKAFGRLVLDPLAQLKLVLDDGGGSCQKALHLYYGAPLVRPAVASRSSVSSTK